MKKQINSIVLLVSVFVVAMGCGGAPGAADTTPAPAEPVQVEAQPTPPPPASMPEREAKIQRVDNTEANRKCRVHDEEDGSQMVVSDENDWFLYLPAGASVECGTFGGKAKFVAGPMTMKLEALVPREGSGKTIESELREQASTFIKTGLHDQYGDGSHLKFEKAKLGKKKRPALCVESDIDLKGMPGKVAACVTSKKNIQEEILVHRVVWVGPVEQYDEKATFSAVKKVASSWFRYSDTDMTGKILHPW